MCALLGTCCDTMTRLRVAVIRLLTSEVGRLTLKCVTRMSSEMVLMGAFVRSAASELLRFAPTVRSTLTYLLFSILFMMTWLGSTCSVPAMST